MKSPLLIVLGIASTMLGLYILIVSLFSIQQRVDYHAGCYQSDQPIDKAFRFRNRLRQLKTSGNHASSLNEKLKTFQVIDPLIRPKSVDLTKNTEVYIQKMTLIKKHQESNMNFFSQLAGSRQSYEQCATQLRQNLDLDNSKNLWVAYQACSNRYEGLKTEIDKLYERRENYMKEIEVLWNREQNSNTNIDFEEELRKIREKYERLNAQNDKNKQTYVAKLKKLQNQNQSKTSQHDESERLFNRATLQYDICLKNLKQFKKCQDISNALKQYGYVEPVQSLQKQIKSKRQILLQMSQLLAESRHDGKQNDVITEMYNKRAQQLLQTMKLNIQLGVDQMKECGCTEETRTKLQKELENTKMRMNLNNKQINDITFEIYSIEKKIKETDEIRQKLVRQLTDETQGLKNKETTNILSLKEKLEILKQNLGGLNSQINQYDRKLNALEFECNQYKESLGLKLKDAQKVTECLKNKDFYEKLSSKAELILRKDIETSLRPIQNVRKCFWAIAYPETIELKRMIKFGNELEQMGGQLTQATQKQQAVHERTLEKEVITIERDITITSPEQKVTIHQEEVIVIEPIHSNEL